MCAKLDATPAWSPDGRLVAFFGQRGPLSGLYLIGADGRGLREVNGNFDTDGLPSWSPDGQYIAYGLSSDGRLGITGLADQPPIALLPDTIALSPAWSPRP